MAGTVIPFPLQLRVISATANASASLATVPTLVDHGGRTYRLADLMAWLSLEEMAQVLATAPRSGQAAWDEVVRRWPALAEEIMAGCICRGDTSIDPGLPKADQA